MTSEREAEIRKFDLMYSAEGTRDSSIAATHRRELLAAWDDTRRELARITLERDQTTFRHTCDCGRSYDVSTKKYE